MVGLHAGVREDLLHGRADRRTAAPDGDDHRRPEAVLEDSDTEFERVHEQILGGEYGFFHARLWRSGVRGDGYNANLEECYRTAVGDP